MNSANNRSFVDLAFTGVHESWRKFFNESGVAPLLTETITKIERLGVPICPRAADILAFARWSLRDARIVLLGQDPYPNASNACGLAFSVPPTQAITPSLRAIYGALHAQHLIPEMPNHGDLTRWCANGVILLNSALTTMEGKSNAHVDMWEPVMRLLISQLSRCHEGLIFFLFGINAWKLATHIGSGSAIQKWGHPSPLNKSNQNPADPKNFIKCTAFAAANNILVERGMRPINWNPNETGQTVPARETPKRAAVVRGKVSSREIELDEPIAPHNVDTIFAFVDGAAHGNGKSNARGAYAVLIATYETEVIIMGTIEQNASNNRAELMAIRELLAYASTDEFIAKYEREPLIIVYDSAYSHGCICEWYDKWVSTDKPLGIHANVDIIAEAADYKRRVEMERKLTWIKVKSHSDAPEDEDSDEYYYWFGNNKVDEIAQGQL